MAWIFPVTQFGVAICTGLTRFTHSLSLGKHPARMVAHELLVALEDL